MDDFDGAVKDYDQALALDPRLVDVFLARGGAREAKLDFDGAIADYDQGAAIEPQRADVLLARGRAIAALKKATGPTDAESYFQRGWSRDSRGDDEGAVADYSKAVDLDPNHRWALLRRAHLRRESDYDGAMSDFTRVISIHPGCMDAWYWRGDLRRQRGDLDSAIADYNQAVALLEPGEDRNFIEKLIEEVRAAKSHASKSEKPPK